MLFIINNPEEDSDKNIQPHLRLEVMFPGLSTGENNDQLQIKPPNLRKYDLTQIYIHKLNNDITLHKYKM